MPTGMPSENSAKRSWPLGYPTRSDTLLGLSGFKKTSLVTTLATAASIYFAIVIAAAGGALSYLNGPALFWIPINLIALVVIARSQRALECLTHEASHYNWSRNTRVNDVLANLLSAVPVFSTVEAFREGHLIHHNNFGMANDPDKNRYASLRIENIARSSTAEFVKAILLRLPAYALGWYKNIRLSPLIVLLAVVWHLVFLVLPIAVFMGAGRGALIWAVYWFVPMTVVLTVIRFIGESGEHSYGLAPNGSVEREDPGERTVFNATITNCGRLHGLVFHPVNDGYHLTHHLYPTIPHLHLKKAHDYLINSDHINYGSRQKYRTRILQNPFRDKSDLTPKARSAGAKG